MPLLLIYLLLPKLYKYTVVITNKTYLKKSQSQKNLKAKSTLLELSFTKANLHIHESISRKIIY